MRTPNPRRWEPVAAGLLLILQPLLFYRAALFSPRWHIPYDIESFHFPLAAYIARSVREGVFPLWDPYSYGGAPIHADITAQLFYPFTWISILLGNHSDGRKLFYWLEWQIPFHMILAGLFTYWLAREMKLPPVAALMGAVVYQIGGFFASQAQHLGAVCSGAWLPLALLAILKLSSRVSIKWVAIWGLAVSMAILSGFPATTAVIFVLSFGAALYLWLLHGRSWKFAGAVTAGFGWGICISAIQWIPTYQISRLTIATMRAQWLGTGGGLRWQSLVSLISPNYYHIYQPFDSKLFTLPINFTLLYVYCGILPLALIVITVLLKQNRLAKLLLLVTIGCAVWMLGNTTPVYTFVFTHLPPALASPLYSEYALLAFSFAAALTAAATLARLAEMGSNSLVKSILWISVLITSADLMEHGASKPMNTGPGSWTKSNSEYELAGYPKGSLSSIRQLVYDRTPPQRMDFADTAPWYFIEDTDLSKIPTMDGDNALMFRRVYLLRRLFCGGNPWERDLPVTQPHSPLLRMMNTGVLAALLPESREQLAQSGLPHLADIAGLYMYAVPDVLPRFYLVPSILVSSGEAETFAVLARPDFSPEKVAVVETGGITPQLFSTGQVKVELYSPNRIELSADTAGREFMASSEPFYPGWTAKVNGRPAPMYMTNGAFRGLFP